MPVGTSLSPEDFERLLQSFPAHDGLQLARVEVGRGGVRASTAKAQIVDGRVVVGRVQLKYSRVHPTVHIEAVELNHSARGRDFGRAFVRHISCQSRRLVQTSLTIEARNDGAYVWARLNFEFTTEAYEALSPHRQQELADSLVRSRSETLRRLLDPPPTSARELALAAGADLQPRTPAELARLGSDGRIGRLLFGSGDDFALWYGIELL